MAKSSQPRLRAPKRSKSKRRAGKRRNIKRKSPRRWGRLAFAIIILGVSAAIIYAAFLDVEIRRQFEGKRWALPARVFARPLELYADQELTAQALEQELRLLRYRKSERTAATGTYSRHGQRITINSRGFMFWDGEEPAQGMRVDFSDGRVSGVRDSSDGSELGLVRLEPVPIANIYPTHKEDRILVQLDQVPQLLIYALMSVEDRRFYDHNGLDFTGLARAMLANLKARRAVQGGSTLTQQLVKNFFLSNERTLRRKVNEAIMALLLEWHYSKDEILQAYINEIYLGQDGQRAIHGFALASQFYFERGLNELQTEQIALLVALVKGPSYYEPRRHPQRAKQRRDLVLDLMEKNKFIGPVEAAQAKASALSVTRAAPSGTTPFPAFVQLVRQQLARDYQEEDLRSEGLVIFTSLDPLTQVKAERAMKKRLQDLERQRGLAQDELQAAVVISGVDTGEVLALIGGRDPQYAGFNRALEAQRPVGSLIKPVVYLTALNNPRDYTLATLLDDEPLTLAAASDQPWSPENYDHEYHGQVMLRDALVYSYNVSTARLGLAVGLEGIIANLQRMGLTRPVEPYPSLLLGAVDLSPFEVSQLYQSIAASGYRVPLSAIRAVVDSEGRPLQRYPLKLEKAVDPASVYLVTAAMHEVTRQGTARSLQYDLPQQLKVAGKTGTTNELRDSWFAGFSDEHLMVVWVGRDNNQPSGLTGSSGALRVWADIMRSIPTRSLNMEMPDNVEWQLIDPLTGLLADDYCAGAQWLPFVKGSQPVEQAPCTHDLGGTVNKTLKWFKGLFN